MKHYQLLTIDGIKAALGVAEDEVGGQVAADAHLYLWVPNAFVNEGYAVARA